MSGRPCWFLLPITQPPPWICSSTGAPGRRVGGAVDVEPVPARSRRRRRTGCCATRSTPRRLNAEREQHARPTRPAPASASTSGSSASSQPGPSVSSNAAANVRSVRRAAPMTSHESEPRRERDREAEPARPRVERAERDEHARRPRAARRGGAARARWSATRRRSRTPSASAGRRGGRNATSVHSAPQIGRREPGDARHGTGSEMPSGPEHARVLRALASRPFGVRTASQATRRSDATPHRARRRVPRARDADRPHAGHGHRGPRSVDHARRRRLVPRARARAARVARCTSCRRSGAGSSRCRSGCTSRSWIEDPDFDLDYHVRRAALPAPGGPHELAAFVGRRRGPPARPRPAAVGGVRRRGSRARLPGVRRQGAPLADRRRRRRRDPRRRCSTSRPTRRLEAPTARPTSGSRTACPSDAEMLGHAGRRSSQRPAQCRARPRTTSCRGVVRGGPTRRASSELDVALPLTAPRLSMNRTITPHRKVAFVVGLARRRQGGEERARRHRQRRRARGHGRRAAQLPRSAAASFPTGRSSPRSRRRCAPRTTTRARQPGLGDVRGAPGRDRRPARRACAAVARSMIGREAGARGGRRHDARRTGPASPRPRCSPGRCALYGRLRLGERHAARRSTSSCRTCPARRSRSTSPARSWSRSTRWARSSTTAGSTSR